MIWVLFYDDRELAERGPAFEALAALRNQISDVGLAIAVSFIAYVVGSLSQAATTRIALVLSPHMPWRTKHGPIGLSDRGFLNLDALIKRAKRDAHAALDPSASDSRFEDWLRENVRTLAYSPHSAATLLVREDLPLVHRRLAGAEATRELFAEIDRIQSEAELRLAIWIPLALAAVVLAVSEWGWWGFFSLVVAIVLALSIASQGISRLEDGNDAIVDSARTTAALPTLELLRETAVSERRVFRRPPATVPDSEST